MKFVYLILVVAVIGGVFIFVVNHKEVEAPTAPAEDIVIPTVDDSVTETVDVIEDEINNQSTKIFEVSGSNFAFDVTEMRVKEGDIVTITFTSAEGFHDWVVDEFDAATDQVRPGTPTSVTFVADKIGTYEYYCSVGSHRAQGMVGTLIVE